MTGWRLESIGRDDPVPTSGVEAASEPDTPEELTADNFSVTPINRPEKKAGSRATPLVILLVVIGLFGASAWYVFDRFSAPGGADVPVIRADRTPVTQEPEDPGGLTIPNQDSVLLERGEVDEEVVSGDTGETVSAIDSEGADGTVPITDIPLNIDSSSDVAGLSDAGEDAAESATTAVAELAEDAASAVDSAEAQANATVSAGEDISAELAEQGGPSGSVPAGSVDVSELSDAAPSAEAIVDEVAEAVDDAGQAVEEVAEQPTVLIERQDDAAAVAESVEQPVEEVLSLESGDDVVGALVDQSITDQNDASAAEDAAAETVAGEATPSEQSGGARVIEIPADGESAAADAADASDAEVTSTEAAPETQVAEAPAEETSATEAAVAEAEAAGEETAEPEADAAPSETESASAATVAPEAAIAPVESGGFRVQMASVQSRETAQQSWTQLRETHPDLLSALTLTVQQAEVRGATYYRVQVGPLDQAGAVDLCETLKTRGQDCLLVRP